MILSIRKYSGVKILLKQVRYEFLFIRYALQGRGYMKVWVTFRFDQSNLIRPYSTFTYNLH